MSSDLRNKLNNIAEDHQECVILAKSMNSNDVYSGTTATASDIAMGKTAYSNGERLEGTMEVNDNNANMNLSLRNGMDGSYKYSQIYQLITKIPDASKINTYTTSAVNMFYGCSALKDVPALDASHIKDMQNMFYGCSNLTEESLNNILLMCVNTPAYTAAKTLKYIGLDESQASKCTGLSNYQAFTNAGWTTGY